MAKWISGLKLVSRYSSIGREADGTSPFSVEHRAKTGEITTLGAAHIAEFRLPLIDYDIDVIDSSTKQPHH